MNCSLVLPRRVIKSVVSRAGAQPETEICGVIGTDFSHYPIANRSLAPKRAFDMDIAQQIAALRAFREARQSLLAIYHSHPRGEAEPSERDLDRAGYPEACMLIVALRAPARATLRAWRREGARLSEVTLQIQE